VTQPTIKLKIRRKSVVKGKALVKFPANVATTEFIRVDKANGAYTFGADFTLLAPGSPTALATSFTAVLDQAAGVYKLVPLSAIGGGGGGTPGGSNGQIQINNSGSFGGIATGTGVTTALGVNVGSAGAVVVNGGAGGTPSSLTLTNASGLPLAGMASQAAFTIVANSTGSSAAPTAVNIASLTTKGSPTGSDYVLISDQAASGALKKAAFPTGGGGSSIPIVIFADGQSNISLMMTYSWSPNANAKIWNNTQNAVNTGSAFVALSSSTVGICEKFASDIADATGRPVYLIKNGYAGMAISHWLSGTGAPDLYANATANLSAALAAIGVSKIDVYLRWQGEADTAPLNTSYVANFATMMGRYWGNSYFPQETPAIICSIASTAISTNADGDHMNALLLAIVNADPDKRRYLYTAALSTSTYWDVSNLGHMTGQGYFSAGAMAASTYLNGPGRNTIPRTIVDPASGFITWGNPGFSSAPFSYNLNSSAATLPTSTGAAIQVAGADSANVFPIYDAFGGFTNFVGRRANGTLASKTTLVTDDIISGLGAQGYDGSAYSAGNQAALHFQAQANWSGSNRSTYGGLYLTPNGSTTGGLYHRWDVGSFKVYGSTSGNVTVAVPAAAGSGTFTLPVDTTDLSTGWTSYTPTITASGGTFTTVTATGRYKRIGKTIHLQITVTMTTVNTAVGLLKASLPVAAAAFDYAGVAKEYVNTGKSGVAQILATDVNNVVTADSTGTTFIANGNKVNYGITYEVP